ncbi:MAG: hypothetical protein JF616_11910 [Fibrobacteres bacterium]|jgi:hypothetical protein|nr:hypothetical protein [Fibrobacterota bacterium]
MPKQSPLWASAYLSLSLSLLLTGCIKPGQDTTGVRQEPSTILDADHGGVRIALPQIDPASLNKVGKDTAVSDTAAQAWFQLDITGDNMKQLIYRFPIPNQSASPIEITGIPAGKKRSFHGILLNGSGVMTHEGTTLADIQGGVLTDVRLYLAKAGGSAGICVLIEGQKLPACAVDSGKVPVDTTPKPGPEMGGSIPMPGSGAKGATLCFEMRFDYADSACETQGFAKMDFLDGKILFGNMMVADNPFIGYSDVHGSYDPASISFYGINENGLTLLGDTLSLQGYMGVGGTMAKGTYQRFPSGKKGIWTMSSVVCGSWIPKYPDASCSAAAK